MKSVRDLKWKVTLGGGSYTPQNPGQLVGDIIIEYNSMAAVVGGTLTFYGYINVIPFLHVVEVFLDGVRIGLGLAGIASTSVEYPSGRLKTTLPWYGFHIKDKDGLRAISIGSSLPAVGVPSGVTLIGGIASPQDNIPTTVTKVVNGYPQTQTVYVPPPYGETVNAAYERVFKGNPLASWGVRADAQRVAGIPSGGPNFQEGEYGVVVQPANYELSDYLNEYAERPGERWHATYHSRVSNQMTPRRGSAVSSEEMLADVVADAPVELLLNQFSDEQATQGSLVGVVRLRDLVANSFNNPEAQDADYQPVAIVVEVQVTFDHPKLPERATPDWNGTNVTPLGTWQDSQASALFSAMTARQGQGSEPLNSAELSAYVLGNYLPADILVTTVEAGGALKVKDKGYWLRLAMSSNAGGTGEALPAVEADDLNITLKGYFRQTFGQFYAAYNDDGTFTNEDGQTNYFSRPIPQTASTIRSKAWAVYLGQLKTRVELGEWLTSSSASGAQTAVYEAQAAVNPVAPPTIGVPPGALFSREFDSWVVEVQEKAQRGQNAVLSLDSEKDTGRIRPLASGINYLTTDNRTLTFRFVAPPALLQQLDPTLGESYNWAFAVTFSTERLGLRAHAKVLSAKYYSKRPTASLPVDKYAPGYTKGEYTTPVIQGILKDRVMSEIFSVNGLQAANWRVIIGKNDFRTEFQAGARSGGS